MPSTYTDLIELQTQLNDLTFAKNKIPNSFLELTTLKTEQFSPANEVIRQISVKYEWVKQYTLCALTEIDELDRCTVEDRQNILVELIDVFHFIASVGLCLGLTPQMIQDGIDARVKLPEVVADEEGDIMETPWELQEEPIDINNVGLSPLHITEDAATLRKAAYDLFYTLPWKHWSKKKEADAAVVITAFWNLLDTWRDVMSFYTSFEQFRNIYIQKNKINVERQMSEVYGIKPKTEDDNKSIVVS